MIEEIPAKTIVTRSKSTAWFGAEYNMNLYRGCPHGCIYCDSRSDCYRNHDFDRVKVKRDALRIVRDDLRRKVRTGVVATGAMSDPYNPAEQSLLLTRRALELVGAYSFGAAIATKSGLVTRDADVLREIARQAPVLVKLTITAADNALCGKLEPYAPPSSRRFQALERLSKQGIYAGVLLMPVLPFVEDTTENILAITRMAAECGARFVYPMFGVTMRTGQREYFLHRLEEHFPGMGEKYRKRYGLSYECRSPRAKELWNAFREEAGRLGLLYKMQDIVRGYRLGYSTEQTSLF